MSTLFFEELKMKSSDITLEVDSYSHGIQTAKIIERYEKVLFDELPNLVIVFGDINSTIACAITAVKINIPVALVEAGLRNFDRTMPEEINHILTDSDGIQGESTFFNVPCLTIRDNTEHPVTISHGTNKLIGTEYTNIPNEIPKVISKPIEKNQSPH